MLIARDVDCAPLPDHDPNKPPPRPLALVWTSPVTAAEQDKAWIHADPATRIADVTLSDRRISLRLLAVEDGRELGTASYDQVSRHGVHPLPPDLPNQPSTSERPAFRPLAEAIANTGARSDDPVTLSHDRLSALIVQRPTLPATPGQVTYLRSSPSTREACPGVIRQRTRSFEHLGHASISPCGNRVFVQTESTLEAYEASDFLGDGARQSMHISGEEAWVMHPPASGRTGRSEFFFLTTKLLVTLFRTGPLPDASGLEAGARAPLSLALARVPTSDYATALAFDLQRRILLVASRNELQLFRIGASNGPECPSVETLLRYSLPEGLGEIRSASLAPHLGANPPAGDGGSLWIALGLRRNERRPTIRNPRASCQVSAVLLRTKPCGALATGFPARYPWSLTTDWNSNSPGLHFEAQAKWFFVSTRSQVWRFEVPK